ncbi:hypothetical protein HOT45_gp39 [Gordonia phage Trine]|uniref:Lipoprotein n=1 Tax=Gordonia phage Trine TaxID=2201431 RepID=A0A2Z4Q917_9CAUD|nr:hypothetical protein HOT45_gp39 [Gordonia phage Trine]AWY06541.1 hypothetical protein PBI_TRINE_39 [Gordonia phage Trine]
MNLPAPRRELIAAVAILAAMLLALTALTSCQTDGPGSRSGESQFRTDVVPAPDLRPSITTTIEEPAMERTYPTEVQLYIQFAREFLAAGLVGETAVTVAQVKADLRDNYGMNVSDDMAEQIRQDILR